MVKIQASPGLTHPRKPWSLLAIILRLPGWLRMLKSLRVLVHLSLALDTPYANPDSMRHRVLSALPKPKAFAALGADGWTKGRRLLRQEQYPSTAESAGKKWRLRLTEIELTWTRTSIWKKKHASNSGQRIYEQKQIVPLFMVTDTIMGRGPRRRRGRTKLYTSSTFGRQRLH